MRVSALRCYAIDVIPVLNKIGFYIEAESFGVGLGSGTFGNFVDYITWLYLQGFHSFKPTKIGPLGFGPRSKLSIRCQTIRKIIKVLLLIDIGRSESVLRSPFQMILTSNGLTLTNKMSLQFQNLLRHIIIILKININANIRMIIQ